MIKKSNNSEEQLPVKKVEKEMSFLEHLEELRWHIVRSILSIIVIAVIVWFLKDTVTRIMYAPRYSTFVTHEFVCNLFGSNCDVPQFKIITRELGEEFLTHLRTSLWLGFVFSFPYIFWEIWKFVRPGLYEHERKAARGIVAICSVLFFMGVLFGYYIMAPFAIAFLSGYSFGETNDSTVMLSSYISYMTMLTLPAGFIFELPILAYILGKIGLISSAFMKKFRRHAIVVIFILGAIITPPDLMTQLLIAFPLMGLYECSIYIVKRIESKEAKES